jgi:hypothetical protein
LPVFNGRTAGSFPIGNRRSTTSPLMTLNDGGSLTTALGPALQARTVAGRRRRQSTGLPLTAAGGANVGRLKDLGTGGLGTEGRGVERTGTVIAGQCRPAAEVTGAAAGSVAEAVVVVDDVVDDPAAALAAGAAPAAINPARAVVTASADQRILGRLMGQCSLVEKGW